MQHLLNQKKLRLVGDVESKMLPDGTRLLKQSQQAEYIALSRTEQAILDRFDGHQSVQDVLYSLLLDQQPFCIRDFYVLVLNCIERGFLIGDGETQAQGRTATFPGRRWPIGWGFKPALISFLLFAPAGIWALQSSRLVLFRTLPEALAILVMVIAVLSVANLLAGCILSGFGRQVYLPKIRWDLGLPFFSVDTRDAFMGGRPCQASVALQGLVPPFLLATCAYLVHSDMAMFAAAISALFLSSPFGDTPAHNLLHALLRREYRLPRCANSFLSRKLLWLLFRPKAMEREEEYLVLYAVYAIAWLGVLILFVVRLIRDQGDIILKNLLFGNQPEVWVLHLIIATGLAIMLLAPCIYQLWMFGRSTYTLLAPYWFRAERRVRKKHKAGETLSREAIAEFLGTTLLFGELPEPGRRAMAACMSFLKVQDRTDIIREGDLAESLFVIYSGRVLVLKENEAGQQKSVATMEGGDAFGEIALLDEVPRTATVLSIGEVELLALHRSDFQKLLVGELGTERVRAIIQICNFLRHHRMLFEWPDRALMALACDMKLIEYEPHSVVIESGLPNDFFYLIYEGTCDVRKTEGHCASLHKGDFFGEISLLKGTVAVADVVAATFCRCLRLDKSRFLKFITEDVLTGLLIESTMESRIPRNTVL